MLHFCVCACWSFVIKLANTSNKRKHNAKFIQKPMWKLIEHKSSRSRLSQSSRRYHKSFLIIYCSRRPLKVARTRSHSERSKLLRHGSWAKYGQPHSCDSCNQTSRHTHEKGHSHSSGFEGPTQRCDTVRGIDLADLCVTFACESSDWCSEQAPKPVCDLWLWIIWLVLWAGP
jgi:hypothetical protein